MTTPTDANRPTSRTIAAVTRTTTVRVNRFALLDLVAEAKRFADAKSTMPILATTLLQVEPEGKLRVAATDLLRTVDGKVKADVATTTTGSLTDFAAALNESVRLGLAAEQSIAFPQPAVGIDAKKLHEVVKALPGSDVDIVFSDRLTLTEVDTFRENKTRVCSICRKRSTQAAADGTCVDKPSYAAKMPCGGKLLDTCRDVSHTVEVSLLSGKSRFNLRSLSSRDFPKLPAVAASAWHRLDAVVLREVLEKVAPTISKDATRSHLNGALLEIGGGLLRGVSTDGHRLAKVDRAVTTTLRTDQGGQKGFVLPLAGVNELLKFLPGLIGKLKKGAVVAADVEVALLLSASAATTDKSHYTTFAWRRPNGDVVYSQKIESAQFPPYDQVIPRDSEKCAVADRAELIAALKRMLISASEKTGGIKVTLRGDEDGGTLQAVALRLSTDSDVGDASEELEGVVGTRCYEWSKTKVPNDRGGVDSADRVPFVFGVNGNYLVAALEEMTSTTVWMGFNGELDPLVLKASANAADVVVVMPMRF